MAEDEKGKSATTINDAAARRIAIHLCDEGWVGDRRPFEGLPWLMKLARAIQKKAPGAADEAEPEPRGRAIIPIAPPFIAQMFEPGFEIRAAIVGGWRDVRILDIHWDRDRRNILLVIESPDLPPTAPGRPLPKVAATFRALGLPGRAQRPRPPW